MDNADFLTFGEAELLVEGLRPTKMETIGSKEWRKQHDYLCRLNQQAQLNAQSGTTEFVGELCTNRATMKTLMMELLTAELWRHQVVPIIVRTKFMPKSTLPFYTTLYNEAVIVNLLETILFKPDAAEVLDEYCLDLVEYCYRTISSLLSFPSNADTAADVGTTPKDIYQTFKTSTYLEFGAKCVSILRYLSEAGGRVPLDTHTRIMEKLNVPQLCVELIDNGCPWYRSDGSFYQSGKWSKSEEVLNPHQLGLLLLVRQLLCSDSSNSYEFHNPNVMSLMRLQKYLTPPILDYCSPLADLAQFLAQLQSNPPPSVPRPGLIIEAEAELRQQLESVYSLLYPQLAKQAMKTWLDPSQQELQSSAAEFMATWDFNKLEQLIDEPPKCEKCGTLAVHRCGQCKRTWYCRRQCQVEHWKEHKKLCALLRER